MNLRNVPDLCVRMIREQGNSKCADQGFDGGALHQLRYSVCVHFDPNGLLSKLQPGVSFVSKIRGPVLIL